MLNTSTLSKIYKSKKWKDKKREKHEANRKLRAELESQKAAFPSKRVELQKQIDMISSGVAT